jgi:hypothetical protein
MAARWTNKKTFFLVLFSKGGQTKGGQRNQVYSVANQHHLIHNGKFFIAFAFSSKLYQASTSYTTANVLTPRNSVKRRFCNQCLNTYENKK